MSDENAKRLLDAMNREASILEADEQARLTSEALVAAHVDHGMKIKDLKRFTDALTVALIAARAQGREAGA